MDMNGRRRKKRRKKSERFLSAPRLMYECTVGFMIESFKQFYYLFFFLRMANFLLYLLEMSFIIIFACALSVCQSAERFRRKNNAVDEFRSNSPVTLLFEWKEWDRINIIYECSGWERKGITFRNDLCHSIETVTCVVHTVCTHLDFN